MLKKSIIYRIPIIRSLAYRIFIRFLPYLKRCHKQKQLLKTTLNSQNCCACNRAVGKFLPMSLTSVKKAAALGFNFEHHCPETCNAEEYSCPWCGATDRDRLQILFLKYFVPKESQLKILHIAPSKAVSKFILKNYPYVEHRSLDRYMQHVDYQLDVTDMHLLHDSTIDLLLCSHVLEHVVDDKRAMREFFRIIKPGGKAMLLVPLFVNVDITDEDPDASEEDRLRRFGQENHVRMYGKKDFVKRLENIGFCVELYGLNRFPQNIFTQHGLTFQNTLYIAHKGSESSIKK